MRGMEQLLDNECAHFLGCRAEDVNREGIVVLVDGPRPLALAVTSRGTVVVSNVLRPADVESVLSGVPAEHVLNKRIVRRLVGLLPARERPWDIGPVHVSLYCTGETFTPHGMTVAQTIPPDDPLWEEWKRDWVDRANPPRLQAVFGVYVVGVRVAHALLVNKGRNPFRGVGVYTAPPHRGKGYAKACLSAVTDYALQRDLVPLYTARVDNATSLAVAHAIGYCEHMRYLTVS